MRVRARLSLVLAGVMIAAVLAGAPAGAQTPPPPPPPPPGGEPGEGDHAGIVGEVHTSPPPVPSPSPPPANPAPGDSGGPPPAMPTDGGGPVPVVVVGPGDEGWDSGLDGACVPTGGGAVCYGDGPDGSTTPELADSPPTYAQLRAEARRLVFSEPMPAPSVSIPPGRGLTGLPMNVVTDAALTYVDVRETAWGPLEIAASSIIYVDWGDGTVTGPYDSPGQAYPAVDITHAYADSGVYDVIVYQYWGVHWTLSWSVDLDVYEIDADTGEPVLDDAGDPIVVGTMPASGVATGTEGYDRPILSAGMVPAFEVGQVQAVRTY